ncbi:transketolase family protein [Luteococcus peritonei]|uniref:Transketolase family protein n=1 Tax=Luteococcus peritonei TaxID=88874 RepID=A0ABW4RV57_9ACTN
MNDPMAGLELRKAYALTVAELFQRFPEEIYALEADLSTSMSTDSLRATMGSHYVNVGIMEAHMVGTAAGLAAVDGFAFVHSFGQFLTRRAMDQVFVSLAYAQLPACLVGSDAGVTAEHNGGTHMTFEDMGIMRVIPGIHVFDVCSPVQLAAVLHRARERKGLTYVRTQRKAPALEVYPEGFEAGDHGAVVLREGSDVSLFACGIEVPEALAAADLLAEQGISAEVVDVFQIKPLDEEVVLRSARRTGAVISCENHSVTNGLGSAVAELLGERMPTPMWRIGVREQFGQVGTTQYLMQQYGLDRESISQAARRLLGM